MKAIRSFFIVSELFFPLVSWVFIYVVYFSFTWFFKEPLNPAVYLLTIGFLACLYMGYYLNGGYLKYDASKAIKKKLNLLIPALIGFSSVVLYFLANLANLHKDVATIRDERFESNTGNVFYDTLYIFLFPLFYISFIWVNFNNLKYKRLINFLALLTCIAFVPINGGRTNFILFGVLYLGIYMVKNFEKLKKHALKSFLKFTGMFFLLVVLAVLFSVVRLGSNNDELITNFYRLQFIQNSALNWLLSIPNGVGAVLGIFIYTFYDYTGGVIYYLSIFYTNSDKISQRTYGAYNFSVFDRFVDINWIKTHDSIDNLYLNSDIEYNVWASSFRDLYVDFGFAGGFIFTFIMALIMFNARKYLYESYAAQVVFFQLLAYFLFAPFHSMFFISPFYGLTFVVSLIMFYRYKSTHRKKVSTVGV